MVLEKSSKQGMRNAIRRQSPFTGLFKACKLRVLDSLEVSGADPLEQIRLIFGRLFCYYVPKHELETVLPLGGFAFLQDDDDIGLSALRGHVHATLNFVSFYLTRNGIPPSHLNWSEDT